MDLVVERWQSEEGDMRGMSEAEFFHLFSEIVTGCILMTPRRDLYTWVNFPTYYTLIDTAP